jgi:hypothetical protein
MRKLKMEDKSLLQIITGKFYNSEDRYHNNCKGILYSNASFRGIYDIGHVKIEAAESLGNVDPYIVMYDNQLQKSHSGFELVKVGDEEILRQLKNILSFALDAVFDEDKSTVERICRKKESGRGKYPVPSEFINGTLDISKNVSDDEMKSCGVFLEQLLALNREDYINILNCIVAYNASVRLLSEDISLAYSMLVYCLESLAQSYNSYIPIWDDYKEDKKNALEKVFKTLDEDAVEKIKEILIKDEHLKLSKRFQEFVVGHIGDKFFYYNEKRKTIGKEEFLVALANAYNIRSKYAHMLKPLMKHLRMSEFSKNADVFEFQHNVYFTYSGLLRVVREVIYDFTFSLQKTGFEAFDWRGAIPGCVELEAAPCYWIWKMDNSKGEGAKARVEGFVETFVHYQNKIPKMDDLIRMYLSHLGEMKEENRLAAFTLCCLYVRKVGNVEDETKTQFNTVFEKNKSLLEKCSIYGLIIYVMGAHIDLNVAWELEECEKVVNAYCKKRYKNSRLKLPKEIESMIYLEVANSFEGEEEKENRQKWRLRAYDNSNNSKEIQELISDCMEKDSTFDISMIWQIINKRFEK